MGSSSRSHAPAWERKSATLGVALAWNYSERAMPQSGSNVRSHAGAWERGKGGSVFASLPTSAMVGKVVRENKRLMDKELRQARNEIANLPHCWDQSFSLSKFPDRSAEVWERKSVW